MYRDRMGNGDQILKGGNEDYEYKEMKGCDFGIKIENWKNIFIVKNFMVFEFICFKKNKIKLCRYVCKQL